MTKKNLKITVALGTLAIAAAAHGQSIRPSYQYPAGSSGTGIPLGDTGFFANPNIGLSAAHDSNLFLTPTNEKSSTLYLVSPGFKIDARRPGFVFTGSYQGQIGHYTDSENDDYVDHVFHLQGDTAFDQRTFLRVGYDFIHGHEQRGSTDRPISTHPDKYEISSPNVTFAYGTLGAPGRIELYYTGAYKKYVNNREFTATGDYTNNQYGGAFYWRAMPKTYLVFDVRQNDIKYVIDSPNSGNERRYFVGVQWEATAATSGTLKAGRLRREFDGPTPTYTSTAWEGTVTWLPLSYSRVDFVTARTTNESTGLGNFIVSSYGTISWTHDWSSYWSTGVNARYQKDDYQGFDRNDTITSLGLRVGYKLRPWLTLGAEYDYTKRDSNLDAYDYNRNFYLVTATAAM